jgi:hypothetical protein
MKESKELGNRLEKLKTFEDRLEETRLPGNGRGEFDS